MAEHAWRAGLARYGAPAAFLAAATIAALLIRAGLKGGNEKSSSPRSETTITNTVARPVNPVYYRIKYGDTLGAVAERFRTSVDALRTLNPGVDPTALRIGQRLRIR